jgi:hypothetical protein
MNNWKEVYQRQHIQAMEGVHRALYQRNNMFLKLNSLRKQLKAKCQELETLKNYNRTATNTNAFREEQSMEHKSKASTPHYVAKPARPKSDLTTGMTELDSSTYDKLMYTEDNRVCFMLGEEKGQRWYYGLGSLHLNVLGTILTMLDESDTNRPIHEIINKIKQDYGQREVMEVFRHSTRNLAEGNLDFLNKKVAEAPAKSTATGNKPRGW